MTEWNLHAADGGGSNIWGNPGNAAVWNETLDDIMRTVHKSMEANWNAYIWWYGKRYYSFIGDGEAAFGTVAGAPLKRGYAFSQYAKYVRPGYQRVALTKSSKASPLEVTAYQGDGKITLVILNRSNSAVNNAVIQAPQNVSQGRALPHLAERQRGQPADQRERRSGHHQRRRPQHLHARVHPLNTSFARSAIDVAGAPATRWGFRPSAGSPSRSSAFQVAVGGAAVLCRTTSWGTTSGRRCGTVSSMAWVTAVMARRPTASKSCWIVVNGGMR